MRRIFTLAALLLPALLLVGTVSADAPSGNTTVPDLVGLKHADAEALATLAGFEMQVTLDPAGPLGVVFAQDPGGFAVRPAGGSIAVRIGGKPETKPPVEPRSAPVAPPVEPPPAPPPAEPEPLPEPPAPPPSESPTGALPDPTPTPAVPSTGPEVVEAPSGDLAGLPSENAPDTQGPPLPSTYGLSRQEAEAKLAGWRVVAEVTLAGAEFEGRVLEQLPMPTSPLAHGQEVTLIFGLAKHPGAEYRQVPPLEGLTQEEATARLASAGFVPVWCTVPSGADALGKVVSHSPRRHSFLLKGEQVRVRLGRGGEGGATPSPSEPAPSEPLPTEPLPSEPLPEPIPTAPPDDVPPSGTLPPTEPVPTPPVEPPPAEPIPEPPVEPPPAEPMPEAPVDPPVAEPAPMPFPAQPPRTAPGPVTLLGPPDEDSRPRAFGATFEWRTVTNADAYEFVLEQEVGDGWQVVRTDNLIGVKFRPANLAVGRYRWRVRALSGDMPGAWTDYRRVYLY
jgi:beta-lactam-binding protein with PASTA domain